MEAHALLIVRDTPIFEVSACQGKHSVGDSRAVLAKGEDELLERAATFLLEDDEMRENIVEMVYQGASVGAIRELREYWRAELEPRWRRDRRNEGQGRASSRIGGWYRYWSTWWLEW